MIRHGQRSTRPICIVTRHSDVIPFTHQPKSQLLKGFDDPRFGSVYGKLGHLDGDPCLGDEGFQHRRFRFKHLRAEGFDVKRNG